MTEKEIGERIHIRRKELGMTLQDIADRVSVARSTIQRYETGTIGQMKIPVIESIAQALGVNPDWLIGKSESKFSSPCAPSRALSVYDVVSAIPVLQRLREYCEDHGIDFSPVFSHYSDPENASCLTYLISYGSMKGNDVMFFKEFFHVEDFKSFLSSEVHYSPKEFAQYDRDEINLVRKYRAASADTKNAARAVLGLSPLETRAEKIG